ncbi:unnamed protein product, partial [marine sediment metagenome]
MVLLQGTAGNPDSSYLPADITYFPDTEWTATTPEEQGMNSTTLDEMIQFIEDESAPIKGLVVTRNGYIVKEGYWMYNSEISFHQIFSCTKSFTGAVVGIAIKEGFIDNVSQKVLDFFPEMTIENMDARKEAMTLEHVLTMTTGLDWNEWNTSYNNPDNMYNQMFGSENPIQFFLNLPTVYDSGTHWAYSTGSSHLLSAIIQEATSMTTRDFAEEYLFDPLNVTLGGWAVDPQGINNATPPEWDQAPVDQLLEVGETLQYDLNASDETGLTTWRLNVTTAFSINIEGVVTTELQLPVGFYPIEVSVCDSHGNWLYGTFVAIFQDTTAPEWVIVPENQILEYGEDLTYRLYATDLSGIGSWAVNDTGNFAISSTGQLTSLVTLDPGIHWLQISVNDTYNNQR